MKEHESRHNAKPDREAALFEAAIELIGQDRSAFLDGVCQGDLTLRRRLEELLSAHEELGGGLADEAAPFLKTIRIEPADDTSAEMVGQIIGRYKLLEKIGEGGCGSVYVAEQTEPIRRRVALKVIKLGMDTKAVVARFEAERQALAMMDHPNIAKVLDAGTTSLGRPYFVMELVRGITITDYCDRSCLGTHERLNLFIKVCHAIQHAHQKGIIHRDIKPSNILVTLHDGVPVPKVIDFGIAKATESRLTEATVYTQLHQFIGTPAYMSPEQAEISGLDIDTRSDIYSLGVLLYELLTGRTPFHGKDLMSLGLDAMRKTIREVEPVRPSTCLAILQGADLTTTAKCRSVDITHLLSQLRGDLDWIVMKCLEKDRKRRYETANALAADILRHLNHEPVVARPPSTTYRFGRAVRRNRLAFAATTAVGLSLVIGLVATSWQARRAARSESVERQTRLAVQRESIKAEQLTDFVMAFLDTVSPDLFYRGDIRALRSLVDTADRLASVSLAGSPEAEVRLREALLLYAGSVLVDFPLWSRQMERLRLIETQLAESGFSLRIPSGWMETTASAPWGARDAEAIFSEYTRWTELALSAREPQYEAIIAKWSGFSVGCGLHGVDASSGERAARYAISLAQSRKLEPPVDAYWGLALSLKLQERFEEAEQAAFNGIRMIHPALPFGEIVFAKQELPRIAADAAFLAGNIPAAYRQLDEVIYRWGNHAPDLVAKFRADKAMLRIREGNWEEGQRQLNALLSESNCPPETWARAALVSAARGHQEEHQRLIRQMFLRFGNQFDPFWGFTMGAASVVGPLDGDMVSIVQGILPGPVQSGDIMDAWTLGNHALLYAWTGDYPYALRQLDRWRDSFQMVHPLWSKAGRLDRLYTLKKTLILGLQGDTEAASSLYQTLDHEDWNSPGMTGKHLNLQWGADALWLQALAIQRQIQHRLPH